MAKKIPVIILAGAGVKGGWSPLQDRVWKIHDTPHQLSTIRGSTLRPLLILGSEWGRAGAFCLEDLKATCKSKYRYKLVIGNGNITSFTGKEQELVEEAKLYSVDVAGTSSTKRRGSNIELDDRTLVFCKACSLVPWEFLVFFRGNDFLLQYVNASLWNFLDQCAAFRLQVVQLVRQEVESS